MQISRKESPLSASIHTDFETSKANQLKELTLSASIHTVFALCLKWRMLAFLDLHSIKKWSLWDRVLLSYMTIVHFCICQQRARVAFLDEKPHAKGSINSIAFLPREGNCFVTGGADHAVVLWKEVENRNLWKSKAFHKFFHSSAVMGVAGMLQKDVVLSAGYDRRIFGFDIQVETLIFRHLMENKCMNVLPNPCDLNLFMVQTG